MPLVKQLTWAWLPAVVLSVWAQQINSNFLDGLFGVYYNTPFQDTLVMAAILALVVGWLAGVVLTVRFIAKEHHKIHVEAIFLALFVFAFLPLFASVLVDLPPAVDLSNCQYPDHAANLHCDEEVGWLG